MIPFMTVNDEFFITANNKKFLVKNHIKNNAIINAFNITHSPNKTTYTVGDIFDPTGLQIMVTYTNRGQTITKEVSRYIIDSTPLAVGQTSTTVTVVYLNYQTTDIPINITVVEPQVSIAVTTQPIKTTYYTEEGFDPSGMVVTATVVKADGTISYPVTDYTYSPTIALQTSDTAITINWSYLNSYSCSTTLPITVLLPTVVLTVQNQPDKTVYEIGEYFDPEGLRVYASVIRGENTQTFEIFDYTIDLSQALTINDDKATIQWTYATVSASTTTPIAVRSYNIIDEQFTSTIDDYSTTDILDMSKSFAIGLKLNQTSIGNNGVVFSNIRPGSNDYGLRLGTINGSYSLTWGNNQTLSFMPSTSTGVVALMIEHEANSPNIIISYNNIASTGSVTLTNNATPTTNLNILCIGAGLDSAGEPHQLFGLDFIGTMIDFSIFNNIIPTRQEVNQYLSITVTPNECLEFSNTASFTLALKTPGKYWDGTLEYSTNKMVWNEWDGSTTITSGQVGSNYKIYMRGYNNSYISPKDITSTNPTFNDDTIYGSNWHFTTNSNNIEIIGNIGSLIDYIGTSNGYMPIIDQQAFFGMFEGNGSIKYAHQLSLSFLTITNYCYTKMFKGCYSLLTTPALEATVMADYSCYQMFEFCSSITNFSTFSATVVGRYCYFHMFYNCTSLATVPSILPAMTLGDSCYSRMFQGCAIIIAPSLPATTLTEYCYEGMFYNCSSLTTAPSLPATILSERCYYNMFYNCTALTTIPSTIPATTLATGCYSSMFYQCSSLTTAPSLPATTLAEFCYDSMFYKCSSLTTAPSLPATTLAKYCYYNMFYDCSSLTTAPSLPATTLPERCYQSMFYNCTALTTINSIAGTTMAGTYSCRQMFQGCSNLIMLPLLHPTILQNFCYYLMFYGCTKIKLSTTQTGDYQTPYRIPASGTGTTATYAVNNMFDNTGGTFTGAPELNTTYYTSNTVV